jgi:hypothetical protein
MEFIRKSGKPLRHGAAARSTLAMVETGQTRKTGTGGRAGTMSGGDMVLVYSTGAH